MRHHHTPRDWNEDLRIGVKVGLLFAAACSLLATTGYFVAGRAAFVAKAMTSLPVVLLYYGIGGLLGGVIIGLLRPLRSTALGSFMIGTLSSVPLLMLFCYSMAPRSQWYPRGVVAIVLTALIMGGGLGAAFHGETHGWTE